ncbi:MAG: heme exporter protein CcmB [Pseudomonadales bacterium]|nr:heme exporter protein CcmB [Pseudomonadales bacterium]
MSKEISGLLRDRSSVFNPLTFLFLGVMLFAVAGPAEGTQRIAYSGAILWLLVLLTSMLSLDGMFRRDYDSGVLEQKLLTHQAPFLVVLMRIFAQWVATGLLIALLSPLLGLLLGIPVEAMSMTFLALLAGTPALSLFGAVGAALTVGFSRGGVLLGLLILPLYLPTLIFGATLVADHATGGGSVAQLYWLAFISMVALTVGPFATTAGLRISLQMQ